MRNIILGIIILFVLLKVLPELVGGLSFLNKFKPSAKSDTVSDTTTLAPPVLNIPFESTNSANLRISGYATPKTTVKIYIDDELKSTSQTLDDGTFQTNSLALNLGTNNIYGKVSDEKNHQSLPSKTIKLTYNSDKPKLDLNGPADNTQIKGGDKKVTVSGSTDPDDSISVNGTTVIVNSDGSFSTTVNLNDGDNNLTVTATNSFGNITTVSRKVNYSS